MVMEPVDPAESLIFDSGETALLDNSSTDLSSYLKEHKMWSTVKLNKWAVIVPSPDEPKIDEFIQTIRTAGKPLGFIISKPKVTTILPIKNMTVSSFKKFIQAAMKKIRRFQLIFVVLPDDMEEGVYECAKNELSSRVGLLSQCILSMDLRREAEELVDFCTKIVIEMNVKLGGIPWTVEIPNKVLQKVMTVGYDVCHHGKVVTTKSVGASVSSASPSHTSFYSNVSFFSTTGEMSTNVVDSLLKSLQAYSKKNKGELVEHIVFYRDGVDQVQFELVLQDELTLILEALDRIYSHCKLHSPKLTFVAVCKNIYSAHFLKMLESQAEIRRLGADFVSLAEPESNDFYLINPTAGQGIGSPTYFKVLYDGSNLGQDTIQGLTFRMCHLYRKSPVETPTVPAMCTYASKLASLTANVIGDVSKEELSNSNSLHFL